MTIEQKKCKYADVKVRYVLWGDDFIEKIEENVFWAYPDTVPFYSEHVSDCPCGKGRYKLTS